MKKLKKRLTIQDKAEIAIKVAVRKAIADRKRRGLPVAVWKDGKAVNIPANKISLKAL